MLVDFGIAKMYSPDLSTTVGAKAVTPGYSPPEQYGMGATDVRSDVYSLGATCYTLLTGQTPPSSLDVMTKRVAPASPVADVNTDVSASVSTAIEKAMQVDWTQRYQTVAEFKAALMVQPTVMRTKPVPVAQPTSVPGEPALQARSIQAETVAIPRAKPRRWVGIVGLVFVVIVIHIII